MIKLLALRERFAHMSGPSGYDVLYDHFQKEFQIDSVFGNFSKQYPRGVGRLLTMAARSISTSSFYNAQSVAAEMRLLLRALKNKPDVIHYCYAEPYFGLLKLVGRQVGAPVVLTHHQPVSWWRKNERILPNYKRVTAVITLSDYDNDYLKQRIKSKTIFIPHGVDTVFFKPAENLQPGKDEAMRVVFSGRYLRDMTTLAKTIRNISAIGLSIHFDVISTDKREVKEPFLLQLMSLPCVTWYANVSPDELLSLYQNAHCCLVPLLDCTANNAILEAMACGLPVVSTNLPAIHSYLDDTFAILGRKGNPDDLCSGLLELYYDAQKRKRMAENARQHAVERFDWKLIALKTENLLYSL